MTIKAKTKSDPKGGNKPIKKGTRSSSLAAIMKSGGVAVVAGKRAKSEGVEEVYVSHGKRSNDDKSDTHEFIDNDINNKHQKHKNKEKNESEMNKDSDIIMVDDSMAEIELDDTKKVINETKWDDTTIKQVGSNKDAKMDIETQVKHWEGQIERIEKAIPKATSKERRESLEIQLATAQLMLKQSLLRINNTNDSIEDRMTKGKQQDIEVDSKCGDEDEAEKTDKKDGYAEDIDMGQTFNWADLSDDDTVLLKNQHDGNDEEWQTVKYKVKKQDIADKEVTVLVDDKKDQLGKSHITNPYAVQGAKHKSNVPDQHGKQTNTNTANDNSSLLNYLEKAKHKKRSPNLNTIRVTTSFTPRTAGFGDLKRVARELLSYAVDFDPSIMLLPWDNNFDGGPININDLSNPASMVDDIKYFFDKPSYVNLQPGAPAYGIGICFSTNLSKNEFIDRWNIKKREFKMQNKVAYTITLAPMQKSPKAYIIGIAVGSTEDQDYDLLNERLEQATGIKGMEASFQNINQVGITPEFWKIANAKATNINADKLSRDHLRTKYLWAPNALALYVPYKEQVNAARKIMIKKYGSLDNGNDPVWPDGSSMRFLPIKGSSIRNAKTKEIVRKRLAYHIWLKANGISLETTMVNIHKQMESFDGKSFSEIILEMTDNSGSRIFQHFNRVWSNDPSQQRWSISIKPHLCDQAQTILRDIKAVLEEKYGSEINQFFREERVSQWLEAVTRRNVVQDDEDDWFDDEDDVDEMIKKGLVDSTFLQFLAGKVDESDRQSVASWGTGDTTYTEICATHTTSSTITSSITQEQSTKTEEEVNLCKTQVQKKLLEKGIPRIEIDDIMAKKSPYELVFSGLHLPSWEVDKEVFLIMAIRSQILSNQYDDDDLYD